MYYIQYRIIMKTLTKILFYAILVIMSPIIGIVIGVDVIRDLYSNNDNN